MKPNNNPNPAPNRTQALSSELSAAELGAASHPVLASDSVASSSAELQPAGLADQSFGAPATAAGPPWGSTQQESEAVPAAAPANLTPAAFPADAARKEDVEDTPAPPSDVRPSIAMYMRSRAHSIRAVRRAYTSSLLSGVHCHDSRSAIVSSACTGLHWNAARHLACSLRLKSRSEPCTLRQLALEHGVRGYQAGTLTDDFITCRLWTVRRRWRPSLPVSCQPRLPSPFCRPASATGKPASPR